MNFWRTLEKIETGKNISFIWHINYPVVVVYDTSLYESG